MFGECVDIKQWGEEMNIKFNKLANIADIDFSDNTVTWFIRIDIQVSFSAYWHNAIFL